MPVVRAALFNLVFYALTALMSVIAVPLLLAPPSWLAWYGQLWVRWTFAALRLTVGLEYRVEGLEHVPAGPALIAAKHQSAWDTLVYRIVIDNMVPVMKQELAQIPIWGWLVRRAGAIAVDRRGGQRALKKLLHDARQARDHGRRIVIFPEGTRTAPGERRRYQSGIAALYGDLDLPVVPVAVNSGLYWPRRKMFGQRSGCIVLKFLEPIPPGLKRREFMAQLEAEIEQAAARLIV